MTLKQAVQQDLKSALKEKKAERVSALRLLLNDIIVKEKQKRAETGEGKDVELTDEEVQSLVASSVKKNREAIEEFKKGQRPDLVAKTEKELEILKKYLPEQLTRDEIEKLVSEAISSVSASSFHDIGRVMKEVMPKLKGRADGNLVRKIVEEKLS